jgi:hypothetical protein
MANRLTLTTINAIQMWRTKVAAGEEAQVDFDTGAFVRPPNGKRGPAVGVPHRAESFPQGVHRSRFATEY